MGRKKIVKLSDGNLRELIEEFESKIVLEGFKFNYFRKIVDQPVKDCKLSKQSFGKEMGASIKTEHILAIDYYGYTKKSDGFFKVTNILTGYDTDNKTVKCPIVYFASIRMEDLTEITSDMTVVRNFTKLKKEIVRRRFFPYHTSSKKTKTKTTYYT